MKCPCCTQPVDPAQHRGIAINRSAYLRSQLISLEAQYARMALFTLKKTEKMLETRLLMVAYEAELEQLKEFL